MKNYLMKICMLPLKFVFRASLVVYKIILKCIYDIDENSLVFRSNPDYSDNARALSEYLEKNDYVGKIYWIVEDDEKMRKNYPNLSVCFVKAKNFLGELTYQFCYVCKTSKYILGTHGTPIKKYQARKGQKVIYLWHGCSFKSATKRDGNGDKKFDYALVPGEIFVDTKSKFWNCSRKKILPIGYPRYDWLINENFVAKNVVDSFREGDNKIVLWMPTFRNDKNNKYCESDLITEFPLIHKEEDWLKLDKICYNNNIKILLKLHPFQKDYNIPYESISNIKKITDEDFYINGITMYEFIKYTDALITDYSSVAIDYLLVDRPIAYTLDDFHMYIKTRGFVFDDPRPYMPGYHLYSLDDLTQFIEDIGIDKDIFSIDRNRVMSLSITSSNSYCRDILEYLGILSENN